MAKAKTQASVSFMKKPRKKIQVFTRNQSQVKTKIVKTIQKHMFLKGNNIFIIN